MVKFLIASFNLISSILICVIGSQFDGTRVLFLETFLIRYGSLGGVHASKSRQLIF